MRPEEVLPHRPPFLFLDEVLEVRPGEGATGRWRPGGEERFFEGHFPGRPTLPGVLMVEALAQLGAFAVLTDPRYKGRLPLFGGVDRARFRRQVLPGEVLDLEVSLERLSSRSGRGEGRARVEGQLACEAGLLFVVVEEG
jgi:3-hydroxyacyl-[acyl-carrier-protein] dehydratase